MSRQNCTSCEMSSVVHKLTVAIFRGLFDHSLQKLFGQKPIVPSIANRQQYRAKSCRNQRLETISLNHSYILTTNATPKNQRK